LKYIAGLILLLGMVSSAGHAQQASFSEEFSLSLQQSASDQSSFVSDQIAISLDPGIPGFVVENIRVTVVLDDAFAFVDTNQGLAAADYSAGLFFSGPSLSVPQGQSYFSGGIVGDQVVSYPPFVEGETLERPKVDVYDFANGNIPDTMTFSGFLNAYPAIPAPPFTFGSAQVNVRGTVYVTFNVEAVELVRVVDITQGCSTDECIANSVLDIAEIRESTIDKGLPLAHAEEVDGSVVAFTDGVGDPFPLFPNAQLFLDDEILFTGNSSIRIVFEDGTLYSYSQNSGVTRMKITKTGSRLLPHSGAEDDLTPRLVVVLNPKGSIGFDEYLNTESEALYGTVGVYQRTSRMAETATQEFVRPFDAQSDPFQIGFDYALLHEDMTMEVLLDNILVGTFTREVGEPDPTDFTHEVIDIDEENGLMLGPVELRFRVTGPVGSEFLIDNVTGPDFYDPGFNFGIGHWFTRGGEMVLAGVVYNELCPGNGDFDRDAQLAVPSNPLDMVKGDVNLDGKPDIVVLTGDLFDTGGPTAITVMLGDGVGGFSAGTDYPLEAPAIRIALHDVTGDIYPDIVFISQSGNEPSPTSYNDGINLMVNDGASGFGSPTTISQNPSDQPFVNSFTITDVNNDQVLDIPYFTGVGIEMRVLIGDGNGGFSEPNPGLSLGSQIVGAMISGDFDEDGDLDLAIGYSTGNVELLNNEGTGIFSRGTVLTTTNEVRQIIANDFNDDGNIDLAVRHWLQSPEAIHIFHGDGAGAFAPTQQLVSGLSAFNRITQMKAGDIDNDGDRDLVVMAQNSNSLTKLVNDGTGVFSEEIIAGDFVSLFAHGRGLVLIDVDRNGSLDVIGDDGFNQTISVFKSQCRTLCIADLTGDDELNFFDVSAFLLAFNSGDTIADFTNDGEFDFFDVSAFLQAFNAGCP